jgi:polyhydroxyalkanoate synthase subunit PhaC
MTSQFNIPDEYIKGILEAGQGLFQVSDAWQLTPTDSVPIALPDASFAKAQAQYWQQQLALWIGTIPHIGARNREPAINPERGDRRFHAREWSDIPWFRFLKDSYLLNSGLVDNVVDGAQLEERQRERLRFFSRQFVDSMCPANFAATNPEAMRLAIASNGESLRTGFSNLQEDVKRGRIAITDEQAFEVGRNVAISKGSVVFENELFQLIQYAPLTEKVAARPLVIVPPCINKFYILDLQPENSFVRFAIEQGQTVFLISWRNPDNEMSQTTWEDYLEFGAMKAIATALDISGADKVNAVGWCVGGTILSSALAVLRAREDESVASLTLLTTMLDFSDPGDLGVFVDEQGVSQREQSIGRGGIYPGKELGFVFQTLKANDLIWPYVVNNYLKGKSPEAFDLLYWNADSTNLPGPMYAWYLRNMYLENNLCVPNRLTMCRSPVDLGRVNMPSYILATQEDHIVPWRGAYRTTRLLGGPCQFVLGASGHIAGVINPASKNKRSYRINGQLDEDPDAWFDSAQTVSGSWWTHWSKWLKPFVGHKVPARKRLGNSKYRAIEAAPGRYVAARAQ